jgi:hypothetical protein
MKVSHKKPSITALYPGDEPVTVKIRFNQWNAPYIEEVCWHPSQTIPPDPDPSRLNYS